jgi:hypothetical protein
MYAMIELLQLQMLRVTTETGKMLAKGECDLK